MIFSTSKNMKWRIVTYFLLATFLTFGAVIIGLYYFEGIVDRTSLWLGFIGMMLLIGLVVGYYAAVMIQRRVDMLHLAIIQLTRGNMAGRIPITGIDPFEHIFRDFNTMAGSLERRIRLLQQIGEENALQRAEHQEAVVQEERRRMARDLHDTVSQQLFAIHMSASSLPKVLERDEAAARQIMEQLIQMSSHAQKEMRGLIAQLRPLELEGKSLQEALDKWFPDYCRQNGLQGNLDLRLQGDVSEGKEHELFLIIQEGMANVVKHASAQRVSLSLHELEHQYVMHINDDGTGFAIGTVKPSSYGLSTMQERAQKLGGTMEVMSRKGTGTRIRVNIPKFD